VIIINKFPIFTQILWPFFTHCPRCDYLNNYSLRWFEWNKKLVQCCLKRNKIIRLVHAYEVWDKQEFLNLSKLQSFKWKIFKLYKQHFETHYSKNPLSAKMMRFLLSIVVLNFGISLARGQSSNYVSHVVNQVEKSPNDDRLYRGLVLKNGMKLMLISDPNANFAGAAFTVGVGKHWAGLQNKLGVIHKYSGSFNDPRNLQGMAHFLEHMLFAGTKKVGLHTKTLLNLIMTYM